MYRASARTQMHKASAHNSCLNQDAELNRASGFDYTLWLQKMSYNYLSVTMLIGLKHLQWLPISLMVKAKACVVAAGSSVCYWIPTAFLRHVCLSCTDGPALLLMCQECTHLTLVPWKALPPRYLHGPLLNEACPDHP